MHYRANLKVPPNRGRTKKEAFTTRIVGTDQSIAEHVYLCVIKLYEIRPFFVVEKDPISLFVDIINRHVMIQALNFLVSFYASPLPVIALHLLQFRLQTLLLPCRRSLIVACLMFYLKPVCPFLSLADNVVTWC